MLTTSHRAQLNGLLILATLGIALVFGAFLPLYPVPVLLLVLALGGLWFVRVLLGPFCTPIFIAIFVALFGMFLDWINPHLLNIELRSYITQLKWLALMLPIIGVMLTNVRAYRFLLRPSSLSARLFLIFLLWSLLGILIRVGLDVDVLVKWLSLCVLYVFAFVVVPAMGKKPESINKVITALAGFSLIVLVGSVFMLLYRQQDAMLMGRFMGIAFNPISLGMILDMAILVFFTLGFTLRRWNVKLLFLILGILSFGFLVLTGARAHLISLLTGLIILGVGISRIYKYKFRMIGLLTLVVLIGIFLAIKLLQTFSIDPALGLLRERGGEEGRLMLLKGGFEVLQANPLNLFTGVGLGVVRKTYYARLGLTEPDLLTEIYADYFWKLLHNSYLEALIETGLPGLLSILGALVIGITATWRIAATSRFPDNILHYGALAILVSGAIASLFESVLLAPGGLLSIWFWSLVGIYSSWQRQCRSGRCF